MKKNIKKAFTRVTLTLLAATSCGLAFGMNKTLMPTIVQIKLQENDIQARNKARLEENIKLCIEAAQLITKENIGRTDWPHLDMILWLLQGGGEPVIEHLASCVSEENILTIPLDVLSALIVHSQNTKHILKLHSIAMSLLSPEEKNMIKMLKQQPCLDFQLFISHSTFIPPSIRRNLLDLAMNLDPELTSNTNSLPHKYKNHTKTQSRQHAQNNLEYVSSFRNQLENKKNISLMLFDIHKKEEQELLNGRLCLYHGQKTYWWLRSYIFKKLMEIFYNNGETIDGYLPLLSLKKPGNNFPLKERARILESGRQDIHDRHNLLFMCIALFGGTPGSCSMEYFLEHNNVNSHTVDIKTLFAEFGLEHLYESSYKERIERVEELLGSFKEGIMYLISATEEQIKKSFYFAKTGGDKETIAINNKPTDDVVQILKTLRHNPEQFTDGSNTAEVCAIMTDGPEGLDLKDPKHDGLLNPFNDGMRAYYYAAEDLKPITKALDRIFDEINLLVNKKQQNIKSRI